MIPTWINVLYRHMTVDVWVCMCVELVENLSTYRIKSIFDWWVDTNKHMSKIVMSKYFSGVLALEVFRCELDS